MRTATRLAAGLALCGLLAGVPAFLVLTFGWPLPTSVPTSADAWEQLLTGSLPDTAVLRLLALAAWLLWAGFLRALAIEARDAWRGVRSPHRLARFHPLRTLASTLIFAIAAGTIAAGTAAARPAQATAGPPAAYGAAPTQAAPTVTLVLPVAPVLAETSTQAPPLLPAGPAVLAITGCEHLYTVVRGDSLWAIAERCLGDGRRWPEIWQLNENKFWPAVSGYKRFDDPDLIYPRWTLKLPASAVAPPDLPQVTPTDPPPPPSSGPADRPSTATTAPTTGPTTATPTVTTPPATATPTTPAQGAPHVSTPATTGAPTPSSSPTDPAPTASTPTPPAVDDDQGVSLPDGSWVPWALAVAISAAAAMVWLQRRRRFIPDGGAPVTDLPTSVKHVDRAVTRNPDLPAPATEVDKAAAVPPQPTPPPGGIGLVGDGAAAAARAAIVSMLAAGGPYEPHHRAEVVLDAATLATLIGPDAVQLAEWPRLHIADDTDAALLHVEAEIVRRGRILNFHATPTVAALREQVPDEEALPPVLLIAEAPATAALARRIEVTAGLGARLNVTILLLGEWTGGPTLHVAPDGHTHLANDCTGEHPLPERMGVLEPDTAAQILLTVREAHTSTPPTTPAQPPISLTAAPTTPHGQADDPTEPVGTGPEPARQPPTDPAALAETTAPAKAQLRLLGTPNINGLVPPQQKLRAKALETAAYLACHPDGASTRDIGEHVAGDYRLQQADTQVHQYLSNLRKIFALVAGQRTTGYILTMTGPTTRFRLNPDNIDIDLWKLRNLLRAATLASGERRRDLLAAACDLAAAPLAEGCKYEWITPFRETARRWATEAHLLYAEILLDTDPQAAAELLDKAIQRDPHNEQLYVKAMHARHALRDADGLRIIMRTLTKAMASIDAEPSEETTALYHRLATSLDQR